MEELADRLKESERVRAKQQQDIDSYANSQDNVGKNVSKLIFLFQRLLILLYRRLSIICPVCCFRNLGSKVIEFDFRRFCFSTIILIEICLKICLSKKIS